MFALEEVWQSNYSSFQCGGLGKQMFFILVSKEGRLKQFFFISSLEEA